jgi:hypothetical protein
MSLVVAGYFDGCSTRLTVIGDASSLHTRDIAGQ